ncbi:hypothetical protein [Methanobacterium sp. A39]|uniref:Uncharacterized protein n=2 Tax=Methanobacterium bryantii TaxID=2161 RepID=A0A2A2H8T4_METBR|nr:hypothetical protein [Methanobacterium sp. A39]OEC87888.1 hypothetical protein A9507_06850 [Methanobacterium sp. A39]PAV05755.1 hypothetical protein ASJ80_08460 [Methanobacterium bryantii]
MIELGENTSLTSDVMIYNALIKAQDTNKLLQQFKIEYPFEGALASNSNSIFVADVTNDLKKKTMNSSHYTALTQIFVKTKNADYKTVSQITRTALEVIEEVLENDESLGRFQPIFMKHSSDYGSKFALKGRSVIVQTKEQRIKTNTDIEVDNVCEMIVKINGEDE